MEVGIKSNCGIYQARGVKVYTLRPSFVEILAAETRTTNHWEVCRHRIFFRIVSSYTDAVFASLIVQ